MAEHNVNPPPSCPDELALAHEFPQLHAFLDGNPYRRPRSPEHWERCLRIARHSQPLLADLRSRGLDLVILDQYTPPETDLHPLYRSILEWLPRITDPLTMTMCLSRLGDPPARPLIKKNRELLFALARQWQAHLGGKDTERILDALSQCVVRVVLERDVPEIEAWARDSRLATAARWSYTQALQRFAKKPGVARQALLDLCDDAAVGGAAVWALAGALKADALPTLQELQTSSPDPRLRTIAAAAAKKITSRIGKLNLPVATPSQLPQNFTSLSIELDTHLIPNFLAILEKETHAHLLPGVADQLALSANRLKRDRHRFHIVQLVKSNGTQAPLAFGFRAEDEDTTFVEVYFDPELEAGITALMRHGFDSDTIA